MHTTAASTQLETSDVTAVRQLIDRAVDADGIRPVSDQFWADLNHGATGLIHAAVSDRAGELVAYAQAAAPAATASWTVETVVRPDHLADRERLLDTLLVAIERAVASAGGSDITWLVQGPTDAHRAVASTRRLVLTRSLHQMRRGLPTGIPFDISTRSFDPERDLDDWVTVNARAFVWNPEQGGWTRANVIARMDEAWFDPSGFLIHERDGRMAGFCWTKIHGAAQIPPVLGEIYIIAVDPDFHGLGLGKALTLAGLHSLAERGATTGMLFVDADNTAAIALYSKLGFTVHRTDSMFNKRLVA